MNPLINNQDQQLMNPMENLMNALRGGANPQELAQNILANNPQAGQMLQAMQQQCGSRNPRDFVLNYCRQNGIDTNMVMSIAQSMGLK